jgi:hypothetical protein
VSTIGSEATVPGVRLCQVCRKPLGAFVGLRESVCDGSLAFDLPIINAVLEVLQTQSAQLHTVFSWQPAGGGLTPDIICGTSILQSRAQLKSRDDRLQRLERLSNRLAMYCTALDAIDYPGESSELRS